MATITIAADGSGDFLAPNSSAYAALSTGSTANTVNWKPGVYRPTTGRWWGLLASRALDKRSTHQVSGSGTVLIDGRTYVPLVESDSVRWDAPSGTWRIELHTVGGGGGSIGDIYDVWFGAETGSSYSDLVMGASYRPAATLGQCNGDGLTVAGMATGAGIWFAVIETSEVDATSAQVIYVWCPLDDAQLPAVQWGGIAALAMQSGSASAGTPRYGALCFARDAASSSNDPSGSYVGPGFVVVGAGRHLLGSTSIDDADASLPVSEVHYDSVIMRGAGINGMRIGSDQTGTTYTDWRLDGEWLYDDHRDPLTCPVFEGTGFNLSAIFAGDRCHSLVVSGGQINVGNSHGAIEVNAIAATTAEARPQNCLFDGVTLTAKPGVNYSRWAGINGSDNAVLARCVVSGFCVRGQFGGIGTLLHGNHISGLTVGTVDDLQGTTPIRVRTGSDPVAADVRVKLYANVVDLRGTDPTYIWSGFDMIANTGQDIPAGCLDARDNVVLCETGQGAFRAQVLNSGTWSTNQTWIGGFTNAVSQAYNGGSSNNAIGTGTTIASLFSTGTVVAPTADSVTDILRRGDTPIRRPTVYGAAAAG